MNTLFESIKAGLLQAIAPRDEPEGCEAGYGSADRLNFNASENRS